MIGNSEEVLRGHCLCGALGCELIGEHNWVGHCHCESCQRATASPFTTWIGQENGTWQFLGGQPRTYDSSVGQQRGFCGTCGSPMFHRSDKYPNKMHSYSALLDNPGHISPQQHYHADECIAWVHLSDGLPKS